MYKKRDETKKIMHMLQLNEDSISTEQIRMIRTNIDQVSDSKMAVLMVTSPNHEGDRSIISAKLAISFAEQGKRILLVDANIRKPSLNKWFQIKNDSGLTNVILNKEEIELHYRETLVPGLYVLPAGLAPLNLSDIWVTSKIKEMVIKCESEFDVVIFEAPPYLTVSDSQMLASLCDGVIIVVKANSTKKEDAIKTKDYLDKTNNRILGVIYQTS
ncbi:tyrosine protein kinase [Bacillus sp. AFS076308]|uniref:CpsD/CapB family tyrosine-protein kinase n=1 Tax=unclassified Bacillus (in: firmicutes) TaxID=185979 RepID=UPI000BF736E7|nr:MULTISPECIES: CpsD/CapB family tyrosine-protein kinase [unclassified Bacillus (in: firmicutes)]PFO04935.1 tyrosine protein kinase [Bacillus sp. AFS076308]PGV51032.1 tyrosine protein kinase [Bacillus sp. AFS037270]